MDMTLFIRVSCGCGFHRYAEGKNIEEVIKVLEEAEAHVNETNHTVTVSGTSRP